MTPYKLSLIDSEATYLSHLDELESLAANNHIASAGYQFGYGSIPVTVAQASSHIHRCAALHTWTISDTTSNIVAASDQIQSWAQTNTITIPLSTPLPVTVAQLLHIESANTDFVKAVGYNGNDPHFTITDSAATISANIDRLSNPAIIANGRTDKYSSITATDNQFVLVSRAQATSDAAALSVLTTPWAISVGDANRRDFNGDHTADILFRNNSTGDTGFYAMSNGVNTGWQRLGTGTSTAYTVATGDFNGDGTPISCSATTRPGTWVSIRWAARRRARSASSAAYGVVGAGDFYGTGTADILFRNNATGDIGFEQMSNGSVTAWHALGGSSSAYAVVGGSATSTATAPADILFRNNATGDMGFEQMGNGAVTAWHALGGSSTAYTVVGHRRLHRQRHLGHSVPQRRTGDVGFYQMSNGALQGWHDIGLSSTAYSVATVGDYNGDGTSDILFRNASTGDVGFYQMSNGALQGWHDIGLPSTAYNVQA